MWEQIQDNRNAIVSILLDRKIAKLIDSVALKLYMSKYYSSLMNDILTVLKSFQHC